MNIPKVKSVESEYELISSDKCRCGGEYQLETQALCISDTHEIWDSIMCRCSKCGIEKEYKFDLSELSWVKAWNDIAWRS